MWNVQVPHNAWTPALFGSLGLKLSDPSFQCHSRGLAEKFDECARLPIADLGSNRLHSTSLNQQLYSFHQTHLSSPKLEARPNLSAEDSLDCPDACTNFSAQRPERWSVLLICHKGSSKPRALESSGSVTNVGTGEALCSWNRMRSRSAQWRWLFVRKSPSRTASTTSSRKRGKCAALCKPPEHVAAGLVLGKASASKPRVACGFGVVFRRESKPQDEEVSARGSYPQRFP